MKKIKKLMSLVMAICMMVTLMPGPVFGATTTTDYSTHWAKNAIEAAMKSGVSKGYPDGSFKPDNAITRAEFFALVNNTFGFTAVSTVAYTDVSADAWYAAEIAKAKAAGYISGYTDGSIHPESNITRQEVAMIISRLKSVTAVSRTLSFTDAPSIADWSKKAVIAAFEAKMMSGYPDGSFQPTAPIKRAEALVAVNNSFAYQANTVKSTDIVYDKAGSYGSATETVTVEGNVVIKAAGVTLQNTIVKGNLTIAKEVGNGEVTLKSVIVKGNTYVNGGGVNSIYFINVITGKVYVLKDDGPVRIVASGTSAIENIMAGSDVKLEEVNMTGKGFEGITVEKNSAGGIDITLVGVTCESVDIQTTGVTLNADKASTIATFTADVKTTVTGAVVIAKAVINASDVTFQTAPTATITAPGITEPTVTPAPAASSGGDGGGSGSSTQLSNLATLVAPGAQTLTATMENVEAAIAALSALVPTVAVTTNPAGTTTLPVVWTYASFPDNYGAAYNQSTAATNVFTWTATLGTVTNTIPIALSGKVTVTNFTVALPPTAEKYFTFNAGTITGYDKAGGLDVVVPGWINGVAVTEIGQGALSYMEEAGLNSLVLPDGLLRIGRAALSDSNLTSIIIPNSVTHIEGLALNCYDLKRLTIGSGVNIEDNLMSIYADRNNNYFREAYLALGAGTYIGSTSTNEANGTWAKLGTVSEVTVYGAGNATTLSAGGTLQMFANVVLLEDATDATITWSVTAGTATIGASTGLLTATGVGTVTVTATNVASGVTGTKDITVTAATVINIAAIPGVTAPMKGSTPVTLITETAQYTGTVVWAPGNNPFAATTVYTATITLTPKTGFTLTDVAANFFTVAGTSTTPTNTINTGVVTAVFPATFTVAIGDAYGGGNVAYILQPGDPGYVSGVAHGLIAATADQGIDIAWSNVLETGIYTTQFEIGTGQANTNAMMAQLGYTGGAATVCNDYTNGEAGTGVYADWYLPSVDELNKLYINKAAIGGFEETEYWSSTEYGYKTALFQWFKTGGSFSFTKDKTYRVRAVRTF